MGAAQGNLAGGEIVEQGACALYLYQVEAINHMERVPHVMFTKPRRHVY
jgi:hypothetical protein